MFAKKGKGNDYALNATIQEINTFLDNGIERGHQDIIWVSGPSYQTSMVPLAYQESNHKMIEVYYNLLPNLAPQNKDHPYLDVFQLTQACHMENCSYDGGHRSRYVNRWKAQMLLNTLCEVKSN